MANGDWCELAAGRWPLAVNYLRKGIRLRTLNEVLVDHLKKALVKTRGRVIPACKLIGVPKTTMYKWLIKYGIKPKEFRDMPVEMVVAQDAVESHECASGQ